MSEEQTADQLAKVRSLAKQVRKNPRQALKEAVKITSLVQYVNPFMDWLYGIALAVAILKDILDFVGIGSLPAIGTVITIMTSFVIGFIMFMTGSFFTARWARRVGILLVGSFVEIIFGVNFLPVETTIVILVFYMTLKSRAESEKKKNQGVQQNISAQENLAPAQI